MRRIASIVAALLMACSAVAAAQSARPTPTALAEQGWTALQERRFGDALEAFVAAVATDRNDPSLAAGAGVAAVMLGQDDDARRWFERSLALAPNYADASVLLGELHYRAGRLQEAIGVYDAARKHHPDEPVFVEKVEQWTKEAQRHRGLYESHGAHFRVLFEGPADEMLARRAVEMLEAAYWRIGTALTAYPPEPITTILYTREQFRDVTRSPEWAAATYDGRIHVPMRGALEHPEELERVLAHEYVHAVVAMLGGRSVPVWLNEGLATAFEPGAGAVEDTPVSAPRLPLTRLERSFGQL